LISSPRILFGVQGTGNGHVSRARALATAFRNVGVQVDWVFSGRAPEGYFDMEVFGAFRTFQGLTFATERGQVRVLRTLRLNHPLQFLREVRSLDLSSYDLVVSDFEPVTAWAARLQGRPALGISHQAAFRHSIPKAESSLVAEGVLRWFAPTHPSVGLHWRRFAPSILPPIIEVEAGGLNPVEGKVLVYLPVESLNDLLPALPSGGPWRFYVYSPEVKSPEDGAWVSLRPLSLEGFRSDMAEASAVLCGAGFELPSECLALGKRLMVKPITGQMEQASNALALEQMGYARVLRRLESDRIRAWLESPDLRIPIRYPDVAAALARWILEGDRNPRSLEALSAQLWREAMVQGG